MAGSAGSPAEEQPAQLVRDRDEGEKKDDEGDEKRVDKVYVEEDRLPGGVLRGRSKRQVGRKVYREREGRNEQRHE